MTHKPYLWPDHVIGKREARRIRDEHNALYNSHAELLAVAKYIVYLADKGIGVPEKAYIDARAAIAKAEAKGKS